MKNFKRLTALMLSLMLALGVCAVTASAASKSKAPISIKLETSASSTDYLGIITVAVTVKNTSSAKVSNIIVSSSDSVGLAMSKINGKNVIVSNPGKAVKHFKLKNNAMTTCLLPGGTLTYTYNVLLGYKYAKHIIPESTSSLMLSQHKLLNAKNFRDVSISAPYVRASEKLTFGDVATLLIVNAYYSVSGSTYNAVESGETVEEAPVAASSSSSSGNKSGGLTPNFKKWVDAYEKFMMTNFYVIKHSDELNTAESLAIMSKYIQYTAELEKYQGSDDLTAEDLIYLDNALARILAYEATVL